MSGEAGSSQGEAPPAGTAMVAEGAGGGKASQGGRGEGGDVPVDPVIQYIVMRKDLSKVLKWPAGAVVSQAAHAAVAAVAASWDEKWTQAYLKDLDRMHKVTLQIDSEEELVGLSKRLEAAGVFHKLWMEQPENVPTCIASAPRPKSELSPHFQGFKLLR